MKKIRWIHFKIDYAIPYWKIAWAIFGLICIFAGYAMLTYEHKMPWWQALIGVVLIRASLI